MSKIYALLGAAHPRELSIYFCYVYPSIIITYKILWIACMNGIKQCIHGEAVEPTYNTCRDTLMERSVTLIEQSLNVLF